MESPNFSTIKKSIRSSNIKGNLSPNQLLFNISSNSNTKTQNKSSNFKFFTTTSQKFGGHNFFLSNKKNRTSSIKDLSSSSKSKQPYQLQLLNHEECFTCSNSKQTTTKNTSTFNNNYNRNSTASINRLRKVCVGSVKKNLMRTLQEPSMNYHIPTTDINTKEDDEEDLEKMVDYIISSTKNYRRDCIWSNKENVNTENIVNEKFNSCKCKKIGCSKYSCNCLKKGIKCGQFCLCCNCMNK